jgi:hypothetical protein
MVVHIHVLRRSHELARQLREDGWTLKVATPDSFEATHPRVADQPAARARLYHLGLLTSSRLRIEFAPEYLAAGSRKVLHGFSTPRQ